MYTKLNQTITFQQMLRSLAWDISLPVYHISEILSILFHFDSARALIRWKEKCIDTTFHIKILAGPYKVLGLTVCDSEWGRKQRLHVVLANSNE